MKTMHMIDTDDKNRELWLDGSELVITKVFDAPRKRVWKAWAEADQLAQWWGLKEFKVVAAKQGFRPGGAFHYSMCAPDGQEMWGKFVYGEIVDQEKIVFINSFTDEYGDPVRHPYSPNWPVEVVHALTFDERAGKTILTLHGWPINATESERRIFNEGRKAMRQGFAETWEQLEKHLTKVEVA